MPFGARQVLRFGGPAPLWPGLQILRSLSLFFISPEQDSDLLLGAEA